MSKKHHFNVPIPDDAKPVKINVPVERLKGSALEAVDRNFENFAGGIEEDPGPKEVFKEGFQQGRESGYEEGFTRGGRLAASQAMGIRLSDTPYPTADEKELLKQFGTREDGVTIKIVEILHSNSVLSQEKRIKATLQALKEVFGIDFNAGSFDGR